MSETPSAPPTRSDGAPEYVLLPPLPVQVEVPALDPAQTAVVDHGRGPLLVLAGPGTGKTTTLVEAAVRRLQAGQGVLLLTFSRRAAAELRRRVAARLGGATQTPTAMTFHSFCLAVVRRFADPELVGPLRLLTAPEQEFRVREVLGGSETPDWPTELGPALPTRAFAAELRQVVARARQLGMDPEQVTAAASAAGRADWLAAAAFFEEYLTVLDAEQVLDYAELVHRCRILLTDAGVRDRLRHELDAVLVDEYQDTDPAQVGVLGSLAGDGRTLLAFADPDQSIYAFRGADPRVVADFRTTFTTASGEPAGVLALASTRRFGTRLAAASRGVAARLPLPPGLEPAVVEAFRNPRVLGDEPGRVEVISCDSVGAEAEHVAQVLRRAHLHEGLDWSQMAVLVRSGRRQIPPLARALTAAGVPVEVAGDEIPLGAEPAVRPLLLALQVAQPGHRLEVEAAEQLLLSPLGGLDGLGLRRLGRRLRAVERTRIAGGAEETGEHGAGEEGVLRPSSELVRLALVEPERLAGCPPAVEVRRVGALAALLAEVAAQVERGEGAEAALWTLWRSTGWPQRLRLAAARGGEAAARAHRDLDAVCALFELAGRSVEVTGSRGLQGFLAEVANQQIPADTLREASVRGTAVRLLTAHRAKGLEWALVVVAGVQEGIWPDLRRRGSLLEAERLGVDGLQPAEPTRARLAEERRLFYVACTRARQRLLVTAVAGTEGEGDQPSRFLTELGVSPQVLTGRPRRPLTLVGLVAELRCTAVDPDSSPALRAAACERLARLGEAVAEDGRELVPAADPGRWWGMAELSRSETGLVPAEEPVRLSGSSLQQLLDCPRRWFLSRRAHADPGRTSSAGLGSVIHVLADHNARGALDPAALGEHLDQVWTQLGFEARWVEPGERAEAEQALARLQAWLGRGGERELVGTEIGFDVTVRAGPEQVRLTGAVDRLEQLPDGRLVVVDIKTGRHAPRPVEVLGTAQLGVYQLAATEGAFEAVSGSRQVAGAELVHLRVQDGRGGPWPTVRHQPSLQTEPHLGPDVLPDTRAEGYPTWVHERLARAAATVRAERLDARPNEGCRHCPFAASCPALGHREVCA